MIAEIKVNFAHGDDPKNATCAECAHPVARHGVNAYGDDGKIHCWDCISVGQAECIHET